MDILINGRTSAMHRKVANEDWNGIIERCDTHPYELVLFDNNKMTPLFLLFLFEAQTAPFIAIKAMVEAAPESVGMQCSSGGRTPLHLSPECPDERVHLLLLRACPKAARTLDSNGCYPLHYFALRKTHTSHRVFREAVCANPAAVLFRSSRYNHTALDFLLIRISMFQRRMGEDADNQERHDELARRIIFRLQSRQNTRLFLDMAAAHEGVPSAIENQGYEDGDSNPLHTMCRLSNVNGHMLQSMVRLNPHWNTQLDKDGNLPLHYAAMNPSCGVFVREVGDSGELNGRYLVKNCLLDRLLDGDSFGVATLPNSHGRLALTLAVESGIGMDDGLNRLAHASASTLCVPDNCTGLYAFMMAALKERALTEGGIHLVKQLNTTYQLLRMTPELVR
jgi:hypothetical protein